MGINFFLKKYVYFCSYITIQQQGSQFSYWEASNGNRILQYFFFGVLNNNIYEKKELGWISLMKIIILKHSDLITKKRKIRWLYHAFEEICHRFNSICVYFHLSTFYWVHCMINCVLWIIEAGDLEKINFWDFITYHISER